MLAILAHLHTWPTSLLVATVGAFLHALATVSGDPPPALPPDVDRATVLACLEAAWPRCPASVRAAQLAVWREVTRQLRAARAATRSAAALAAAARAPATRGRSAANRDHRR